MFVRSYVHDFPFYKRPRGVIGHILVMGKLRHHDDPIINRRPLRRATIRVDGYHREHYRVLLDAASVLSIRGLGYGSSSIAIRADQSGSASGEVRYSPFNTSAFANAVGHFGWSPELLGPGYQIWDMSVMKNFNFGERASLQLRLDVQYL
jgi:hypothetical protein